MRKWLIGFATAILSGLIVWWITYQGDFTLSTDRRYVDVLGGTIWEEIAIRNTGGKELSEFDLQIVLGNYRLHPQARSAGRPNGFDLFVATRALGGLSPPCERTERVGVTISKFTCALLNPKENMGIDIRYPSIYERTPNVTIRLRDKGFSYEETFDGERLPCHDNFGSIICRP